MLKQLIIETLLKVHFYFCKLFFENYKYRAFEHLFNLFLTYVRQWFFFLENARMHQWWKKERENFLPN